MQRVNETARCWGVVMWILTVLIGLCKWWWWYYPSIPPSTLYQVGLPDNKMISLVVLHLYLAPMTVTLPRYVCANTLATSVPSLWFPPFFGIINCTNHLSIKVFRHCTKKNCHPQRHLRLPVDSHGHEQGREDVLDGVAQLDRLPLGHNHLGRLAGGGQRGPVVCACHGEYVGRAPQTWRNLQVNSNVPTPSKEVFCHSTFQGDDDSKQPHPHVHYSSLWWIQVQQDKTTRQQDFAMLTHYTSKPKLNKL